MRNLWGLFRSLLPTDRRLVGAVVAHNADGTSTIQINTGVFRARGQLVAVGQQAEIEGGAVMRQTVTLPIITIEI